MFVISFQQNKVTIFIIYIFFYAILFEKFSVDYFFICENLSVLINETLKNLYKKKILRVTK